MKKAIAMLLLAWLAGASVEAESQSTALNFYLLQAQEAYQKKDYQKYLAGAYDPEEDKFYAGSLYKGKIVSFDRSGKPSDFTSEKQDGLWSVVGIKIDGSRNVLWACSAAEPIMKGYQPDTLGRLTGIFKYDLKTKKLLKTYLLPKDASFHLFNDLVLTQNGTVYITDYFGQAVYCLSPKKDELQLFVQSDNLAQANGIAISEEDKHLFVAFASGVAVFHTDTKKRFDIIFPSHLTLAETDGLYFYRNSLIAIQTAQNRVNRYGLSPDHRRITNCQIIDSYHPRFDMPTTGVLVGDTFYYVANSQYASFDENGNIFPIAKLKESVILKVNL